MHILNFTKDWQSASQKGAVGGGLFTFLLAEHKIIVSHTSSPSLVTCFFLIITNLMCVKHISVCSFPYLGLLYFLANQAFLYLNCQLISFAYFSIWYLAFIFFFKNLLYVFRNWSLLDLKKMQVFLPNSNFYLWHSLLSKNVLFQCNHI